LEANGRFAPKAAYQKVLLLIALANRDESRWERPDQLDITRRVAGQIAFGTGIHGSVAPDRSPGSKARRVLGALAARVVSITIEGDAVHHDSPGLRAFSSLPVRVTGK
jgi:4-methoxybenzoate monooxygenase (O-demethylating)